VRRRGEEELRRQAEEEATQRRAEEERLASEHAARVRVEEEATNFAEEETRLKLEASRLRQAAAELAKRRSAIDDAARVAQLAEAKRRRREAEEQHTAEMDRLRSEEESLRHTTGRALQRRREVDVARQEIAALLQRLDEEKSQLAAAATIARDTEAERIQEAQDNHRAEQEQLLLRINELRRLTEEVAAQRATVEASRQNAEDEARRLAEARKGIEEAEENRREAEDLITAEAEARNRIEEADVNRRRAEKSLSLTVEILQRAEAEAHARAAEEERILTKLADVRRNVAFEAQAREEQANRLREEIERMQGLEEAQRQRLEQETRRRREAESRLQLEKDRYRAEEEARINAEVEVHLLREPEHELGEESAWEWHDDPAENLRPISPAPANDSAERADNDPQSIRDRVDELAVSDLSPIILEHLDSDDPVIRAAALRELAQSGSADAFALIVQSFDDHSVEVRNAAACALRDLEPYRPGETFTRALDGASTERRQSIGSAIATSGLAAEAIEALRGDNREDTYNALCLLLAMANTGELQPLVQAVEAHQDVEVRRAAVKLLTLAGQQEVAGAAAKRRLDVEG
jgi:hypothetical protein